MMYIHYFFQDRFLRFLEADVFDCQRLLGCTYEDALYELALGAIRFEED